MTKAELIERIAKSRDLPPDLTRKDIALILGVAFEELSSYFARTKVTRTSSPRFTFPHFGTFTKKRRSARRGVNPRTLEPMEIEAFDTVDFKASRELREAMNPGTSAQAKAPRATTKTAVKANGRAAGKARKTKRAAAAAVPALRSTAPAGRRLLTPRDEEAELDAMIADDELFAGVDARGREAANDKTGEALPPARLQRVELGDSEEARPRPRRRSRTLS